MASDTGGEGKGLSDRLGVGGLEKRVQNISSSSDLAEDIIIIIIIYSS